MAIPGTRPTSLADRLAPRGKEPRASREAGGQSGREERIVLGSPVRGLGPVRFQSFFGALFASASEASGAGPESRSGATTMRASGARRFSGDPGLRCHAFYYPTRSTTGPARAQALACGWAGFKAGETDAGSGCRSKKPTAHSVKEQLIPVDPNVDRARSHRPQERCRPTAANLPPVLARAAAAGSRPGCYAAASRHHPVQRAIRLDRTCWWQSYLPPD